MNTYEFNTALYDAIMLDENNFGDQSPEKIGHYTVVFKNGEFENEVKKVTVDHKNKKVVLER